MRRIKLTVAYDGTDFHGWQVQPNLPTIQQHLEQIFTGIEKRPVHVAGSGRTDAGVHALAQVAAASIENPIPTANLKKAINRLLPPTVRVLAVEEVHDDFHPRYDAISKTYEYRIWRGEVVAPFEQRFLHHHPYQLSDAAFCAASTLFEGEHDFSAFAAADDRDAEGRSKVRTIYRSEARRCGDLLTYRVTGSGFLKHMVRNIVGTLLEAGKGNLGENGIKRLLSNQPGLRANPTAPAKGLFLIEVQYSSSG
jgi:tRNA pseudouridine38-40 synthase